MSGRAHVSLQHFYSFTNCLCAGFLMYFGYGMWHSVEGERPLKANTDPARVDDDEEDKAT